ncbi:hypothetical protein HOB10_00135 [Candidatus Parcubacteria bacterium]|nr:hypothetical protein [Candidatus Parcubacteria bacterium]
MCKHDDQSLNAHVLKIIVDIIVPKNKAQDAAAAIRVEGKYSIFAVLNQHSDSESDNQSHGVHILVAIRIQSRAEFYAHLRKVCGTLQLKYNELD